MMTGSELFLPEEIMLLALRDEAGTMIASEKLHFSLGGAIAAELLLNQRIAVDEQKKKKKIIDLNDATPIGDPVIDECLEKIVKAKRRANLQTWVRRFAQTKRLKVRVAEKLCQRGILRADEGKVLWIFKRKIFPEVDPGPEKALIERLREAIFTDSDSIDPRTVVLLSLAKSVDILKYIFDKKELKDRKKRIEQVVEGEMTGKAAREVIKAAQAAVVVVIAAAAVSSGGSGGGS